MTIIASLVLEPPWGHPGKPGMCLCAAVCRSIICTQLSMCNMLPPAPALLGRTSPLLAHCAGWFLYFSDSKHMPASFIAISATVVVGIVRNITAVKMVEFTSPLAFNLLGHFTVVLLLLASFPSLEDYGGATRLTGCAIALSGLFAFARVSYDTPWRYTHAHSPYGASL